MGVFYALPNTNTDVRIIYMKKYNSKQGFGGIGILIIIIILILGGLYVYNLGQKNSVANSDFEINLGDINQDEQVNIKTTPTNNTTSNQGNSNNQTNTNNSTSTGGQITTSTNTQTTSSTTNSTSQNQIQNTDFELFIVNANSGINVPNPTIAISGNSYSSIANFLTYASSVTPGEYDVTFTASGFQPLTTDINLPFTNEGYTANLVPINWNYDCPSSESAQNQIKICGFISDENRDPLSNVQISSPNLPGLTGSTNQNGFFEVSAPLSMSFGCGTLFTVSYSKNGYTTLNHQMEGVVFPGMSSSVRYILTSGSGSENKLESHGTCPQ